MNCWKAKLFIMNNKIFDKNRSIGSIAHKVFGALLCDECRIPTDNLFQFELEDGNASEDSYCNTCWEKVNNMLISSQAISTLKEGSETTGELKRS
jgi:hypothetical protein